jgi:hypothetical protein
VTPSRSKTFTAGDLAPTDLLLGSTASDTLAAVFTDGDLLVSVLHLPRVVTITRSLSTASYTTDAITIRDKQGVVDLITPADADGGDVLRSATLLDNIASIEFPAQADGSGAYTIGVDDIGPPKGDKLKGVMLHAAGNLHVIYGTPGVEDTIPVAAAMTVPLEIVPSRIVTNAAATAPTTVALTAFF